MCQLLIKKLMDRIKKLMGRIKKLMDRIKKLIARIKKLMARIREGWVVDWICRRWGEGREGGTGKKTCVCDLTRRRPEIVKPTKMELQGVQGGVWGANKLQKSRCHGTKIEVWRRLGVSWGGLGASWRCLGAS